MNDRVYANKLNHNTIKQKNETEEKHPDAIFFHNTKCHFDVKKPPKSQRTSRKQMQFGCGCQKKKTLTLRKNHEAKRHSRNSNILQCHFLYCDIFFPRSPTMPVVSSFLFTVTWIVILSSNGKRPVY
ncbi:hypothetical protein NPIL_551511 [Nephila pilipes]|uniref:Uncharacterized protein n=1 Tax=Nephila pilipes TaxID=299642 RepID=A0A8X6UM27_NEPPI|nr:hypothetical protein NPIL_551511 [Nephila pilipes]